MSKKKKCLDPCPVDLAVYYDKDLSTEAGMYVGSFDCDLAEGHKGSHRHTEEGDKGFKNKRVKFTVKW